MTFLNVFINVMNRNVKIQILKFDGSKIMKV